MNLPDAIILQCELRSSSFIEFSQLAINVLKEIRLPGIIGWQLVGTETIHCNGVDGALEAIKKLNASQLPSITLLLPNESSINLHFNAHTQQGMVRASIDPSMPDKASVRDLVVKQFTYLKRLFESGKMVKGAIWRQGGGVEQLPAVPLVYPNAYAVVVTPAMVEKNYQDVNAFWRSGWDQIETYGATKLLARALNAASGAEFLAFAQRHQRALARIAKPKLTIYADTESTDEEERAIYESGHETLRVTTYLEDEHTLVFTCTLEPEEHIQGWEIDRLYQILKKKILQDGRVVKVVRIFFPDESTAQREKRPLLDIGAEVQYMDASGNFEIIRE